MLNVSVDKLSFLIENLYISTHASGIALLDGLGDVAAECGDIDIPAASELLRNTCNNSQQVLKFFTGIIDNEFFTLTQGLKGSFVIAKVNERFFLVVFYSKEVDLLSISHELKKFAQDVRLTFKGL